MNNVTKKKQRKSPPIAINKIALAILISQGLAYTATAAEVEISPVISNGGSAAKSNKAPNLWFTVDDSGSMGALGTGVFVTTERKRVRKCNYDYWGRPYNCRNVYQNVETKKEYDGHLVYGYLPYDPAVHYEEMIPVDHKGNKLPLPSDEDKTYSLGPWQGKEKSKNYNKYAIYNDIFIWYARKNMGVQVDSGYQTKVDQNGGSSTAPRELLITKTGKILEDTYENKLYRSKIESDTTCDKATNKKRCQVWKTYYSSRMLALKSGLSLALHKHRDAKYRFGFQGFWTQADSGSAWKFKSRNWRLSNPKNASTRWGIWGSNTGKTNVDRISLFPLRENTDTNRKELYKWLFTLIPDAGTPTRGVVSYLFNQIKTEAHGGSPTGSIYREDPSKPYNKDTNPAYTCRRNHNIILTDGQWETSYADATEAAVRTKLSGYTDKTTEASTSFKLPDGQHSYSAKVPYKATPTLLANYNARKANRGVTQLADIAFRGWITDLDGNEDNNKKDQNGAVLAKEYEDYNLVGTDGKPKIYKNGSSAYWHHFYNPATWQNITTHAIGFGLDTSEYGDIHINPPKTKEQAALLGGTGEWNLNKIMSGQKKWGRSTWSDNRNYSKDSLPEQSLRMKIDTAVADMARTAIAGRGLFYNAKSGKDILSAFDEILATVGDEGNATPAITGSSGTAGRSQKAGNHYFASRFDIGSFTGELVRYNLFDGNPAAENVSKCFKSAPSPLRIGAVCDIPAKNTAGKEWNTAKLLTERGWKQRNIITMKRQLDSNDLQPTIPAGTNIDKLSYKVVDFDTDKINPAQKNRLVTNLPAIVTAKFSNTDTRLEALFNYIKGDKANEPTFRSRDQHEYGDKTTGRNILGSIMRSSPVYVGLPRVYLGHLSPTGSAYTKYVENIEAMITANANGEKEVIYVGANDGMLHAFSANTGQELFAYVPSAVYDKLPQTVIPDKKVSLVDGNLDVQYVNFGNSTTGDDANDNWQNVLIGAMGGGAKGLYALNVTNANAADVKTATVGNWEYDRLESQLFNNGKSNVGNILAAPSVIQLHDNTWVAIVGNGYNSESGKAAVLVIDLETGKPIQELVLENTEEAEDGKPYTDTAKPNGLGPLYFASYRKTKQSDTNKYDRAYAGDLQGNLWVLDLVGSSKTTGIKVAKQKNNKPLPLFTATTKDADDNEVRQAITVTPKVAKHPLGYGHIVHFGTGALFAEDDFTSKTPNTIYAIWDDWIEKDNGGLPNPRTKSVVDDELNDVKLVSKTVTLVDGSTEEVRHLDDANNNPTSWRLGTPVGHRGWKIDLLAGERAWQEAETFFGARNVEAIGYNTVNYKTTSEASQCGGGGKSVTSSRLAFNSQDASRFIPASGALDVNNDGVINASDKFKATLTNSNGQSSVQEKAVSGTNKSGVISYNSGGSTQEIVGGSNDPAKGGSNSCKYNRQTVVMSDGKLEGVTVTRCSYFSSWKELKAE